MTAEIDRIDATRDLVGSFSSFLDEFAACWGGLRVANDQMRSALLEDLIETVGGRAALAKWIDARLASEHADLVAPLVSLLWSSGGTTRGALHTFEVCLEDSAPIGTAHLAEALEAAFEAYHARHTVGGPTLRGSATDLLAATAVAEHRFGLPSAIEEQLERLTGGIWGAVLDRDFRPADAIWNDPGTDPRALLATSRGWERNAVVGLVELIALPGLLVRQYSLTHLLAPHTEIVLQQARQLDDLSAIRQHIGPALVTAWDSLAHTFGEEGKEVSPDPPAALDLEDDPFWEPGGYGMDLGPEASLLLSAGTWFPGLLTDNGAVPRLSGGARALLASPSSTTRSGDPHIAATLDEASAALARLGRNLGDSGATHLAALTQKSDSLEAADRGESSQRLTAYVLRVAQALTTVADEAAAFAEHLDAADGELMGDLDRGLRLAAIQAWLDGVARWIVSEAVAPTSQVALDRSTTPPAGYRDPRHLVQELVAALPERPSTDELRLVVEQREAQWDDLATLEDSGPPDLTQDHRGVVDIDGFANRF